MRTMIASLLALAMVPALQGRAQAPSRPDGASAPTAAGAGATGASGGPIMPVHRDPHHRQLFQRGPVRILELQLPPGDRSLFHSHEWPVLYVTLSNSPMRTENLAAPGGPGPAAAPVTGRGRGAVPRAGATASRAAGPAPASAPRPTSTTSYIETPVVHLIENTGTGLVRAVVVVNETKGDTTRTAPEAGFTGTPELTNSWFRAYRLVLGAGEKAQGHTHRTPVVVVQATAGTAVGLGPTRWEFNQPGQWAYFDAGTPHEVQNTGSGPVELIEVEVRAN